MGYYAGPASTSPEALLYWERRNRETLNNIHKIIDRIDINSDLYWRCIECLSDDVESEPYVVGREIRFLPKATPENTDLRYL